MLTRIACPTDFSSESALAFDHALALALATRARLDLLHVHGLDEAEAWRKFPRVRERLIAWGHLAADAAPGDVEGATGMAVRKIEIEDRNPLDGLNEFFTRHRPDLVVMGSHGRLGLERLVKGSVSTALATEARLPVLLFGPEARGFVDPASGAVNVGRILAPVAHEPPAGAALSRLDGMFDGIGGELDCLHVGDEPCVVRGNDVRTVKGDVIAEILAAAQGASLIAMPTAGRHGLLDALRGSTTEQIVARAPCPVLALPVAN